MNREPPLLRNLAPASFRLPRWAGVIALGLLAAACADVSRVRRLSDLPPPKDSTVSQQVLEAGRRPTRYPTFQQIPGVPHDVRPEAAWGVAVRQVKADSAQLQAEVAARPPFFTDTSEFAARAVAEAAPPPPPEATDTEAYAQSLRERLQPPPKPK